MNQLRSALCLVIFTLLLLSVLPAFAAPTVAIGTPSSTITKNGPVSYTITYTGATLVTLSASDITLNKTGTANGTVLISGSGTFFPTVSVVGITGDGTIGISVAAGTAVDGVGNPAPAAGPSTTFLVDGIDPTINISSPTVGSTKTGPVSYTVTYADANFNTSTLAAANVVLNSTGTATGTVSIVGTTGNTRTVTISSISGEGTLGISINAGTASDLAGNTAPVAGPSGTFTCDSIAPTVTISAPSVPLSKSGPVTYTVTFTDTNFLNSTLLTAPKVNLIKTGTANGTVSVDVGNGSTRTVTISSLTGTGTLAISIQAGTARDVIGNTSLASVLSAVCIVDNTSPTISISAPSVAYTSAGPVTYTVTYTDSNFASSSLSLSDITLVPTGTAVGTVSVDGGTGSSRIVTISAISGEGTLKITIAAGTAIDLLGSLAPASIASPVITVDNTGPTISIGPPSVSGTKSGPVSYNVTYSDLHFNASSLAPGQITLISTGTAFGTLSVTGSGNSRKVTISTITGEGTLGISIAAGSATDLAGNSTPASGPSATFTCDSILPTVSISPPSVASTTSGPVTYTVTYADTNFSTSTLTAANVSLVKTGTATGTVVVDNASGTTRIVTINSISGSGTLAISVAAGTATDQAGNKAPASSNSINFIVDNIAPTVTISAPSATRTATGPVSYTVTYSDLNFASSSLSLADITLNATGTATGTLSVGSGNGSVRSVTISSISGDGTLGISIGAGTAVDLSGNTALGSLASTPFAVDNTAPTISIGAPSLTETRSGPVTYNITYADANFNASTLSPSQITVISTGSATGVVTVTGTGTTRTVKISAITGFGTLAISIAPGTATDLAGNVAPGAGPSATVNCDSINPLISIGAPSLVGTTNIPVSYTVTYADANFNISTLKATDVTLIKTGTAAGTVAVDNGTGTTRTVTINSITGSGTLAIVIAAGTAVDLAGNLAPASSASISFIVDNTAPTISIGAPSSIRTTAGPISYVVTYADSNFTSSTLSLADITLNKTGTATGTVSVDNGTGASRTVTINGISGDGTLGITIAAGTTIDLTGNQAPAAGPSATFSVDNSVPSISIGAPSINVTKTGPVTFNVTYTDANLNTSTLTAGDVTLIRTGTANGTITVAAGTGATRVVTIASISGEGSLQISIGAGTATDLFGNSAPASTVSAAVSVDSILPTVTISAPSAIGTRTGPVTYTVTYADTNFFASTLTVANITLNKTGSASGIVTVDGGSGAVRTVTISSITGQGTLGISIGASGTASDVVGNKAPAAGPSATFVVDSIAPTVVIGAPSATITAAGPVTYRVTYSDTNFISSTLSPADITFNTTGSATGIVSVDSGTGAVRIVTISSISGDGTLGISIAAGTTVDLAGNTALAAGPAVPFVVDNSRSVAIITVPADNAFVSGNFTTLSGVASDAGSFVQRVELSMDNGATWSTANGSNSWSFSWTLPLDGSYPVLARAVDAAGNIQTPASAITVNVSATPPDTFITSGPSDPSTQTSSVFTFKSSKPEATFECKIDAVAFVPCQSPFTTALLADGRHILIVRAQDASGTYDPSPAIYTWDVKNTASIAVLTGVPASPSPVNNAEIAVAGPDIVSYQFQLDSGTWSVEAPVAIPISFTGLADGLHTLRVKGRDALQNTLQSVPTTVIWTVETNLPITTIVRGPATLSHTESGIFIFRSSKPGTTFQCQLERESLIPCSSPYVYTAYSKGNHSFAVRGTDLAGTTEPNFPSYSWEIDTESKIALLANTPPGLTNSATSTIQVYGAGIVAYRYRLDAGAYSADFDPSIPISLKGLADGTHALSVMGKDAAGTYQSTPTSILWTVDTVAPTTTIVSLPPAVSNLATGNIAFSSSKPGSTFKCTLDTGSATVCSSPFGFLALGGGSHKVTITATDPAGNVQTAATVASWIVDVTSLAPTVAISAPSATSTKTDSVTYTVTYADANFNGSTLTAANITLNRTGTATGIVTVDSGTGTVRTVTISSITGVGTLGFSIGAGTASDLEGNKAPAAGPSATFVVDNAAPTVNIGAPSAIISAPSATITVAGPVTYTVTYSDTNFLNSTLSPADITLNTTGSATGVVTVDSSSGAVRTITIGSISGDGTLGISIAAGTAVDLTGNRASAAGPSVPFVVDNSRSVAVITVPATNAFVSGSVTTLRGTASDAGSYVQRVELSMDNGASWSTASGSNSWSFNWTLPLDGSYPVLARAVDAAGNFQSPPSTITVNVSTKPPDTFITSGPSDPSNQASGIFTFISDKPGSTFECMTDSVTFVPCQSPYTTASLADGRHILIVRAHDASGAYDPSPAMYTWSVRNQARIAVLSGVPASPSPINNAEIHVAGPGIVSYQFQLDSGTWSVETLVASPISFTGLTDGLHTLRVRGRDALLNTLQSVPTTVIWTVETTLPTTTIVRGPATLSNSASGMFIFRSTKPGTTFQCQLDGGSFDPCASPFTYTALASGAHTFAVMGTDLIGNSEPAPASSSWVIDTESRIALLANTPPALTNSTTATIQVFGAGVIAYRYRLDAGAYSADFDPSIAISLKGLADGAHSLSVLGKDASGTYQSSPTSIVWTVDTFAPTATIISQPPIVSNSATGNIVFSATKPGSTFKCTLDTGSASTCSSPYSFGALGGGVHKLSIVATDPAGNIQVKATVASWTVDVTAPTASVAYSPTGAYKQGDVVTITATFSKSMAITPVPQIALSGGNILNAIDMQKVDATHYVHQHTIGDGSGTVFVSLATGTDLLGNEVVATPTAGSTFIVNVSAIPPSLSISTLADGTVTNTDTLNVSGIVTCPNGIKTFTINGEPVSVALNGSFTRALSLNEGVNTIISIVTDNTGKTAQDTRVVTLDATAPLFSVLSPADNSTLAAGFVTVAGTITVATTTVQVSLNGGTPHFAAITGNSFSSTVNLVSGMNTMIIVATDLAAKTASIKRTIMYDSTRPGLAITDPDQDSTSHVTAMLLKGTVSDALATTTVSVSMDGQIFTPLLVNGAFQQQLTFTAAKQYAIVVTAADQNGTSVAANRNVIYVQSSGDLNNDGRVDVSDALLAMRMATGMITPTAAELLAGDVSPQVGGKPVPDGKIDISDALLILRRAVNLQTW
jgi:hypothetical protein